MSSKVEVYKLTKTFAKDLDKLLNFGFSLCKAEDGEIFFAQPIVLPKDCHVVNNIKRTLEKIYEHCNTKEREEFTDLKFVEVYSTGENGFEQTKEYHLMMSEENIKEFTNCELVIAATGIQEKTLFINAPDKIEYYNSEVLDESCPELVKYLLENKVIYKKKIKVR